MHDRFEYILIYLPCVSFVSSHRSVFMSQAIYINIESENNFHRSGLAMKKYGSAVEVLFEQPISFISIKY